jgi:type IV pilus assembly protein PilN
MVRINLLPEKRATARRASQPSQLWLIAVAAIVVVEIAIAAVVQGFKSSQLQAAVADNARIQSQIDTIKKQIANHAEIKAKLKELRDRQEAIQKLQSARTGPTSTLLEVSKILTSGRGPTTDRDKLEQLKRDNPSAVLNANWDTRRLWITSYQETERNVKLAGLARDSEDVSELERRLILSDYFYEVKLLPGSKIVDATTHQELVKFELSAKVKY